MSFLKSSTSFTRFRLVDEVPADLWAAIPDKLKQFAFQDIDDIPQERSFGWVNFDDMLDTTWRLSPPEKADYITFSLRLDTRRIPPAVLKKHTRIAVQEEEAAARNASVPAQIVSARRCRYPSVTSRASSSALDKKPHSTMTDA